MSLMSARVREQHYRLLANLYLRPPSEALLEAIRDGGVLPIATAAPGEGAPATTADLEAEHTALFVLPSGVIPHEAFYRDRDQRLGGRVTIAVEQFYRRAGIRVRDRCVEMPDHLGLELEFMAALCRLEAGLEEAPDAAALERCVAFQSAFLEEHLSRWAPECCENVIRHAQGGFYQALARFTTEFLSSEQAHLAVRHAQGAGSCEPAQH